MLGWVYQLSRKAVNYLFCNIVLQCLVHDVGFSFRTGTDALIYKTPDVALISFDLYLRHFVRFKKVFEDRLDMVPASGE